MIDFARQRVVLPKKGLSTQRANPAFRMMEDAASEEWLVRYVTELGHAPGNADQLRAFAAHRGGQLSYGAARRAVAAQFAAVPAALPPPRAADAAAAALVTASPVSAALRRRHEVVPPLGTPQRGPVAPAATSRTLRGPVMNVASVASHFGNVVLTTPRPGAGPSPVRAPATNRRRLLSMPARESDVLRRRLALFQPDSVADEAQDGAFIQQLLALVREAETQAEAQARASAEAAVRRLQDALPLAMVAPETECAICLACDDPIGWRTLPCGHHYHDKCLLEWVRRASHRACPLCRFDLDAAVGDQGHSGHVHGHTLEQGQEEAEAPAVVEELEQLSAPVAPLVRAVAPGALRELELAREDLERMQHLSQSLREVQRSMETMSVDQRRSVLAVLGAAHQHLFGVSTSSSLAS